MVCSMLRLLAIACCFLILITTQAVGQQHCGTEKLDSLRRKRNPNLETLDTFEEWMANQRLKKTSGANRTQSTYTIPVVVHIIHNGEAIGTGLNISNAQVISQINVLNKDFQRLNADATNTPAEFQDEASAISLEFVLAKQDPQGNATTGIVRVNGGQSSWQLYEDAALKAKSYWPAEQYFNIWVSNIPEYLGYSTFPVTNLAGMENSSEDRLRDGVIMHYQAFGSAEDGSFDLEANFNKGRTLTHETGHFLGLRHIWGDGSSCSATDYVNDTPPQISSTSGCPTHPQVQCASTPKMFQNYMDYTYDACMNLFTAGQLGRVETVLQNSPRRASLLTSPGAFPPGNFSLDLGITSAAEPTTLECSGTHTPTLTIRNFGTTTITQASIRMQINGATIQTITPTLALGSLQQTQITFNSYNSNPGDSRDFVFTILSVNGTSDEYSGNNSITIKTKTAQQSALPYTETFEGSLSNLNILNPDALITWAPRTLSASQGTALYVNNYAYEEEGAVDQFFSPVLNASAAAGLLLKFKLAHAHAFGFDGDALAVYATTGCTDDLSNATRVFFKEGSALGTTTPNSGAFTPTATSWKTQYVSLVDFIGSPILRLAFVSRNGYGNNIFLDSIQVLGDAIDDLSIQQVIEPSWAVCETTIQPKLTIENQGSTTANGFTISTTRNSSILSSQTFATALNPGAEITVELPEIGLISGKNELIFTVSTGGVVDDNPGNNVVQWPVTQIINQQTIPSREDFTQYEPWEIINRGNESWTLGGTNYQVSAVFPASSNDYDNIGEESWFVSPKLDFSKAVEASMFADFSYAKNGARDEYVRVKLSNNCGTSFDHVLLEQYASEFTGLNQSNPWTPSSESHWTREYFDLNDFAGQSNILISVQIVNDNGNNFYMDNIEFYESDDRTPPEIDSRFRVYSNASLSETFVTFNLKDQQPAEVIVSNIMGANIAGITLDNALNQTVTFQLDNAPAVYIFRVRIGNEWKVVKHYTGN